VVGNQVVGKIACKHPLPQSRHSFGLHDLRLQRTRQWRRAELSAIEASVKRNAKASQQGSLESALLATKIN